jgi:pimeloyl-ACP methyl ester carboxylesterase
LAFSEAGTGAPLVILHGLFGSKRNWSSIANRLAQHHRVITADMRNHGESPWDDRHDYPALADDVARLIETKVGGPAAVIGHQRVQGVDIRVHRSYVVKSCLL